MDSKAQIFTFWFPWTIGGFICMERPLPSRGCGPHLSASPLPNPTFHHIFSVFFLRFFPYFSSYFSSYSNICQPPDLPDQTFSSFSFGTNLCFYEKFDHLTHLIVNAHYGLYVRIWGNKYIFSNIFDCFKSCSKTIPKAKSLPVATGHTILSSSAGKDWF